MAETGVHRSFERLASRFRDKFGPSAISLDFETTSKHCGDAHLTRGAVWVSDTGAVFKFGTDELVDVWKHVIQPSMVLIAQNVRYEIGCLRKWIGEGPVDRWLRNVTIVDPFMPPASSGIGFISMENMCISNKPSLEFAKTGSGAEAIDLWKTGKIEELEDYNVMDVVVPVELVLLDEIRFCVSVYIKETASRRHIGAGILNMTTFHVQFLPGVFPQPDLDETNCACACSCARA